MTANEQALYAEMQELGYYRSIGKNMRTVSRFFKKNDTTPCT